MANTMNLEKASEALQFLKNNEKGGKNLESLAAAFDDFRKKIPTKLNDSEFDWVLKTLLAQKSLAHTIKPTAGGFVILSVK